ncbi:hypothetical protein A2803_03455 [Candidatus Woesebacteria bacterium RIFCSPHIGHO2_01_FULL_44_21]|uniref:Uncharacterized protein n=1 Tax=Candidatus Woesebacteria bacterium RIFCSPHIGHO2_01_FULL_44_21 TaxID=1802503 RepID=A0A1F7YYR5_9BACT|nr:MAG: hypothetical protein A2803_03455 [Candidatus Woesebacteria bacterium RIFCSPHIGHO2_01_FULL_44_21]OGM69114.1 MAG: hypothetical protein A2897_04785 [Candidatus Woesebacteria bacterium RIFCSPLOWO2_01_FULL_44_24b]
MVRMPEIYLNGKGPESSLSYDLQEAITSLNESEKRSVLIGLRLNLEERGQLVEKHQELVRVYEDYFEPKRTDEVDIEMVKYRKNFSKLLINVWTLPEDGVAAAKKLLSEEGPLGSPLRRPK